MSNVRLHSPPVYVEEMNAVISGSLDRNICVTDAGERTETISGCLTHSSELWVELGKESTSTRRKKLGPVIAFPILLPYLVKSTQKSRATLAHFFASAQMKILLTCTCRGEGALESPGRAHQGCEHGGLVQQLQRRRRHQRDAIRSVAEEWHASVYDIEKASSGISCNRSMKVPHVLSTGGSVPDAIFGTRTVTGSQRSFSIT
eukprot:405149-Pelagomonas_calceolata.AAC.4